MYYFNIVWITMIRGGTTYRGGCAIAHPEVLKTKGKKIKNKKLYKYCIDVEHP